MKHYLLLLFCGLSLAGKAQNLTIENNSKQSDSCVQLFKNYLIQKEALATDHISTLRIEDYYLGMDEMTLEFVGYQMGNSIFRPFTSSVRFYITDSTTGLSYNGLVLETQVFVNKIAFYNFNNPELFNTPLKDRYLKVLQTYYPKCSLDSNVMHFVNDQNGKYIGQFHMEYKTKTREGCLVTDNYSIISENSYTVLGKAYNCEPVIVFYSGAAKEFNDDDRFYGEQFEMYDGFNNLIHKGVFSRYNGR
jgi:hypothetical protein